MDLPYSAPRIVDHGDVRAVTAARYGHQFADANIPAGSPTIPNSTGPCIGFSVPCT